MVSTLEQMQVPNGTGVRRSKRPLLASRTKRKKESASKSVQIVKTERQIKGEIY